MVDFTETNLQDLFDDLEWHLVAKDTINSFYEECGFPPPHDAYKEECMKTFQRLHREWERRVPQYSEFSTAKFFRRRDETSALYLGMYHLEAFARATNWGEGRFNLPDPFQSYWSEYIREQLTDPLQLKGFVAETA